MFVEGLSSSHRLSVRHCSVSMDAAEGMEARLLVVAGSQRLAASLAHAVRDKPPRLYIRIDNPALFPEVRSRLF